MVVLTLERWLHIRVRHEDMRALRDAILSIVRAPDERLAGREPGEVWLYRRGCGPSRYVKVVVHYEDDRGSIRTAFPRRRFP